MEWKLLERIPFVDQVPVRQGRNRQSFNTGLQGPKYSSKFDDGEIRWCQECRRPTSLHSVFCAFNVEAADELDEYATGEIRSCGLVCDAVNRRNVEKFEDVEKSFCFYGVEKTRNQSNLLDNQSPESAVAKPDNSTLKSEEDEDKISEAILRHSGSYFCWRCGIPGHLGNKCPKSPRHFVLPKVTKMPKVKDTSEETESNTQKLAQVNQVIVTNDKKVIPEKTRDSPSYACQDISKGSVEPIETGAEEKIVDEATEEDEGAIEELKEAGEEKPPKSSEHQEEPPAATPVETEVESGGETWDETAPETQDEKEPAEEKDSGLPSTVALLPMKPTEIGVRKESLELTELVESMASMIMEQDLPRQEAIQGVVEKELEKAFGVEGKPTIDEVAGKIHSETEFNNEYSNDEAPRWINVISLHNRKVRRIEGMQTKKFKCRNWWKQVRWKNKCYIIDSLVESIN